MLQFILGAWVGGIVGFAVCALCSMARANDCADEQPTKDSGESDAASK